MDEQGRSTPRLIADAFGLYRRYPLLFLVLAAAVIVPYQLLELVWRGNDGTHRSAGNAAISIGLGLFYSVVVGPLVSALHIHAVADVRAGEEPRLLPIARRGWRCCRSSARRRSWPGSGPSAAPCSSSSRGSFS
jgi:hypothetical protein